MHAPSATATSLVPAGLAELVAPRAGVARCAPSRRWRRRGPSGDHRARRPILAELADDGDRAPGGWRRPDAMRFARPYWPGAKSDELASASRSWRRLGQQLRQSGCDAIRISEQSFELPARGAASAGVAIAADAAVPPLTAALSRGRIPMPRRARSPPSLVPPPYPDAAPRPVPRAAPGSLPRRRPVPRRTRSRAAPGSLAPRY